MTTSRLDAAKAYLAERNLTPAVRQPGASRVLGGWIGPEAKRRVAANARAFAGARLDRLTDSWRATSERINDELRTDLARFQLILGDLPIALVGPCLTVTHRLAPVRCSTSFRRWWMTSLWVISLVSTTSASSAGRNGDTARVESRWSRRRTSASTVS